MILIQAIRNAMVNGIVVRNVADLATVPAGKPGRPSRSLNLDQALAVLDAAKGERLWRYVAVSMFGGIRTEVAGALRWSEVDLGAGPAAVCRSVRRTAEPRIEQIADVMGHSSTRTTEVVCKHLLRPVTRTAAIALGRWSRAEEEQAGAKAEN